MLPSKQRINSYQNSTANNKLEIICLQNAFYVGCSRMCHIMIAYSQSKYYHLRRNQAQRNLLLYSDTYYICRHIRAIAVNRNNVAFNSELYAARSKIRGRQKSPRACSAFFFFSHKSVRVFMSGSNLSHSARYCLANARSKPHFYNGGASNWLWKRYKRP